MVAQIFAVKPKSSNGAVHLNSPGYRPGKKGRSVLDEAALCGMLVAGRDRQPLADALSWRVPEGVSWTWCRPCVGHAVMAVDMAREVLTGVSTRLP